MPVREADGLVRACAARFGPDSPAAALGPELVAAHVTVLWPFLAPSLIDTAVLRDIAAVCEKHPRHRFRLERLAAYPGGTVYMPPEPADLLLGLMHDVWNRWPETPPYGGIYDEVNPHVTLAVLEDRAELIPQVRSFAEPHLPIDATAEEVMLLLVENGRWRLLEQFPLGELD